MYQRVKILVSSLEKKLSFGPAVLVLYRGISWNILCSIYGSLGHWFNFQCKYLSWALRKSIQSSYPFRHKLYKFTYFNHLLVISKCIFSISIIYFHNYICSIFYFQIYQYIFWCLAMIDCNHWFQEEATPYPKD